MAAQLWFAQLWFAQLHLNKPKDSWDNVLWTGETEVDVFVH